VQNEYYVNNPFRKEKEMLLKAFVQYFKITKNQFDAATTQYITDCELGGKDMTFEEFEAPNADIIYTFDDAIINNFYRYA